MPKTCSQRESVSSLFQSDETASVVHLVGLGLLARQAGKEAKARAGDTPGSASNDKRDTVPKNDLHLLLRFTPAKKHYAIWQKGHSTGGETPLGRQTAAPAKSYLSFFFIFPRYEAPGFAPDKPDPLRGLRLLRPTLARVIFLPK